VKLVVSAGLLAERGGPRDPTDLTTIPSLGWWSAEQHRARRLDGPDGATARIHPEPRMVTEDMAALRFS
jgi:hypothetical protein